MPALFDSSSHIPGDSNILNECTQVAFAGYLHSIIGSKHVIIPYLQLLIMKYYLQKYKIQNKSWQHMRYPLTQAFTLYKLRFEGLISEERTIAVVCR